MEDKALDLLKTLLEIPSVNSRDRESLVAEYLADYFKKHGIEAKVQYVDDTHANVLAYIPGTEPGCRMIWNGHLDTVPYGNTEEWNTNPAEAVLKDGKLFARGASDMKSGLAAMVYALCHTPKRPAYGIQFLGTCDEEKNGLGASAVLKDGMEDAPYLLVGEPTDMRLGIAQKGCLWLEIRVSGKTSHGAYPQEGISAIHHGISLAAGLKAYVESFSSKVLGASTAQITMIHGGVAMNMTADECSVKMDIRMVPGLTKEMILAEGEKLLCKEQAGASGLKAELLVLNDRRAIEIDSGSSLPSSLRRILCSHGYEGSDIGINFFTDASVLDREGKKKILLFGPGEPSMAHKPNEYVSIKKYQDAIQVLLELMQEQIPE